MAYREIFEIEVRHEGLNKYRHIRGSDRYIVKQKAVAQKLAWDDMWEKKQAVELKKRERDAAIRSKEEKRDAAIRNKEEKKELAIAKTEEAQKVLDDLGSILKHTLLVDDAIDWSSLLDEKPFPKNKPSKPSPEVIPDEPKRSDQKYQPRLGFLDKIFSGSRKRKQDEAESLFLNDHNSWVERRENIESKKKDLELKYSKSVELWEKEKASYEQKQQSNNNLIQDKKEQYSNKEAGAISDYCEMVLSNSVYPDYFPQEWDIEYQPETRIIIVDYSLPDIESIPTLNGVKYVTSRDELSETYISAAALNKLYDSLLYQIALRTIHELYEADVVDALESIVFNGWVNSIDKATGQNVNSCIMSLQAKKDEFSAINLGKVDPKACFKQLKGVGSSKLHGLSPVAPIININKEDRRFVSAYAVVDEVGGADNLAAMDWQDFENLIREIFEKEFASSGGEVKITQASRDGGVDAIAFDPDPIRGGKIVIQAKRYTNVVGVSAVRDLYGTTVNEGATKGILVTTADYGPDAYEFAKGKPLTLLNGGNLLHLLDKHGHKAKIDLKEAKKILSEQKI
uniref:Restriction system protein n=1 Tax=Candidatus Kentrum sp. DK TaxID=2126562 RepID=A0A450SW80_9GAMM|nr:MAG: restriction system protein [Candidatus Kentron sp. DK]